MKIYIMIYQINGSKYILGVEIIPSKKECEYKVFIEKALEGSRYATVLITLNKADVFSPLYWCFSAGSLKWRQMLVSENM